MSKFVSLNPKNLGKDFDTATLSEQPVVSVKEDDRIIEVSYAFPGFSASEVSPILVDGDRISFKEIGISGAGFVSESGKPLLPSFGRLVQIPAGCDYEVQVSLGSKTIYDNMLVVPAQENATDGPGESKIEFNKQAYQSRELYPAENVRVTDFDMLVY